MSKMITFKYDHFDHIIKKIFFSVCKSDMNSV